MIKFSNLCGILLTFACLFLFAGCDLSFTRPSTGNDTGNFITDRYDRNEGTTSGGGKDKNKIEIDDIEANNAIYSDMKEYYQGVRLLTQPTPGAKTNTALTDAERERFYFNVINQYEVMADYILTSLVGQFGMGSTQTVVESSPFNGQTTGDYVLEINPYTPQDRSSASGFKNDSDYLVIDGFASGWGVVQEPCTPVLNDTTGEYECKTNHTYSTQINKNHCWLLNLNSQTFTNAQDYLQTYLNNYSTFIQLRIMQIVLDEPRTSYVNFSPTTAQEDMKLYAQKFDQLGLNFTNEQKEEIRDFILEEVIGYTAINYAKQQKSFTEPTFVASYTYTDNTDPSNPTQQTIDVTHYADVNNNGVGAETITNPQMYVTNYEQALDTILYELYEKIEEFVDFYALEIIDINSEKFFQIGEVNAEDENMKLQNIDMAEYKSVIFLGEEIQAFNMVYFMFSSEKDMVMDIYLNISDGNSQVLKAIGAVNVNSEYGFDYYEENDEYADFNYLTATDEEVKEKDLNDMFNTEQVHNYTFCMLEYLFDEDEMEILQNTFETSEIYSALKYEEADSRKGYHTNSKDNTTVSPSEKIDNQMYQKTTYKNEETNGEKELICANSNSTANCFVEIIFDVRKTNELEQYPFNFAVALM
ncbi:MAG: hypothetical protein IJW25_00710 [Clostridia bacterium]|nr:hypothetical protein [Clostridia bacterium]